MKIKKEKGRHFETDNIIKIKTDGYETFHLRKLLLVLNQLALNEQNKYKNAPENKEKLWFVKAVDRFMEDGYNYVDLLDDKNQHLLQGYSDKFKIKNLVQSKINDFEKENGHTS